jgi:hypothetical protein
VVDDQGLGQGAEVDGRRYKRGFWVQPQP